MGSTQFYKHSFGTQVQYSTIILNFNPKLVPNNILITFRSLSQCHRNLKIKWIQMGLKGIKHNIHASKIKFT